MDRPSTSMLRYATRVGAALVARDDAASDDAAAAAEATIIPRDAAAKARARVLSMMKFPDWGWSSWKFGPADLHCNDEICSHNRQLCRSWIGTIYAMCSRWRANERWL